MRLGRRGAITGALALASCAVTRRARAEEPPSEAPPDPAAAAPAPSAPAPSVPAAPALDRTVARTYRLPTPGSNIDTGGAVIVVRAPIAKVRRVLLDYAGYHDILPRVEQSRVVSVQDGETDVYFRAPILRGVAHIWMVARFGDPQPWSKTGFKLEGRYIKGNLDDWHGAWFAYPCGPKRTVLRLELFIDIAIPVPSALVTPELEWAAEKGVRAVRDIAECARSTVTGA